jgi:hypothetical protein
VQEDVRILELGRHGLGVVDEVGREVAAVELHALDHVELVFEALPVLDGDHAFLADLVHRRGDDVADGTVGVGGDGAHLRDRLAVGGRLGERLERVDGCSHGLVDAALQIHRIHARGDGLQALAHHGLGEHGGGRRAVTGHVGGLGGDLLDHLRAHVLELVLELDLLRHGHAVLRDGGRAEALLDHHVAALGSERGLHGVGENVDARGHAGAGVVVESDFFRCHLRVP